MNEAQTLDLARRTAEDALRDYARLAFAWNAPDDEYTRYSLRRIVEDAITEHELRQAVG